MALDYDHAVEVEVSGLASQSLEQAESHVHIAPG
jgi:hypothetical protein